MASGLFCGLARSGVESVDGADEQAISILRDLCFPCGLGEGCVTVSIVPVGDYFLVHFVPVDPSVLARHDRKEPRDRVVHPYGEKLP